MRNYPYTIENGAGEWLTFSRRTERSGAERVEGEARVAPGAGPPMHVHYLQDEAFTVLEGHLGYQIAGRPPAFAAPGETILFPAGQPHRFWNAGEDELRCSAYIEPAGNAEYFLSELFASQRRRGGQRPGIFDVAFLTRRYRSEYGFVAIPPIVQRLLFPLIVAIGSVLGRFDRYSDAPEPMRR
jgi:quercetin dioxygenase-like cupin family protein